VKFVYHPRFEEHVQWSGHPERPDRVRAIMARLRQQEPEGAFVTPEAATKREIMRVHDEDFVERIRTGVEGTIDGDTFLHRDTYAIAALSAGAALAATRHARTKNEEAFAITRPPGHHAGLRTAGGFCYFNNAAIAAESLWRQEGLAPVAILDLDVHHGNGTQDIFGGRSEVVYLSTHQEGIYPGTGAASETGHDGGQGRMVNVPLPEGSGDATFDDAWKRVLLPVLEAAKPAALIVSLGIDAHYQDPLANLTLSSAGYVRIAAAAAAFAREHARMPAVFALEGGYDLDALADTVGGLALALRGEDPATKLNTVRDAKGLGARAVDAAARIQARHWGIEG
jgi:acetoin utilization deacetylase AcuC-like enzyme